MLLPDRPQPVNNVQAFVPVISGLKPMIYKLPHSAMAAGEVANEMRSPLHLRMSVGGASGQANRLKDRQVQEIVAHVCDFSGAQVVFPANGLEDG